MTDSEALTVYSIVAKVGFEKTTSTIIILNVTSELVYVPMFALMVTGYFPATMLGLDYKVTVIYVWVLVEVT